MFDWNTRILLFAQKGSQQIRSHQNVTQIVRIGVRSVEVDLRFLSVSEGLEYVANAGEFYELCIFKRGETVPLNGPKEIRRGIVEGFGSMEEEKYWLAHEIFEDFWKHYNGDLKTFYHGVILLCVSMVHFQMGHESNSRRIFVEARSVLERFIMEASSWEFSYPLNDTILDRIRKHALAITDL